jgi:uncharacterized membrane protein YdjX (TVP38/TMEM64 family)
MWSVLTEMNVLYISNLTELATKLKDENFTDVIIEFLNRYESLGPLPGILLPFIEAIFPFLPLIVFVLGNAALYGLYEGFLYSWIGASAGAIVVFFSIRRLGNVEWVDKKIKKNKQVLRITGWVERHGFGSLFLLLCFPFSPSSVINVVAGLSKVSVKQFILAVLLGKSVMIFSVAYVGSSITEFVDKPLKTMVVLLLVGLFWLVGKQIENRMKKRMVEES